MGRRRKSNKATGPTPTEGTDEPVDSGPPPGTEPGPPVRRRVFTYALADMPVRRDS